VKNYKALQIYLIITAITVTVVVMVLSSKELANGYLAGWPNTSVDVGTVIQLHLY
jgi:hypothetical protein